MTNVTNLKELWDQFLPFMRSIFDQITTIKINYFVKFFQHSYKTTTGWTFICSLTANREVISLIKLYSLCHPSCAFFISYTTRNQTSQLQTWQKFIGPCFLKNKHRVELHDLRTQPTITDWFTSILNAIHSWRVHSCFWESIVCKYKSARRERIIVIVTGRARCWAPC